MCLTCWTTEKDPRQGSPLSSLELSSSAWMQGTKEKDWHKKPSDCQLQEAQKKTLLGPHLLWWRQSMSLHTCHRQGLHKPSSCATFALKSHWGRAATGKKNLASMHAGSLRSCPSLCNSIEWPIWRRKWQPTPVFLPGESQGRRSLVGCRLWGRTESDSTEAT